ncbi:MAG: O-antigen ligase family protein, partial [Verrucomicrobiota bacterium]|nr:O-antigen ligase family protein [Verrucomicrobiota bacterium]
MFLKNLIIALACLIVSAFASYWLAIGDYTSLILIAMACFVMITVLVPGYSFLFAFGLLCPFIFPLPFVFAFPTIGLTLGLIAFKYIARRSLSASKTAPHFGILATPILFFFGLVVFRYCLNPVFPGMALGLNNDVSGFRFYANYGICFFLLILLGYIFVTREGLTKLFHAMAIISFFFIALFLPLIFTKSMAVAQILGQLGLFVSAFDTGVFRIIALPSFGLVLWTLGFFPRLISLTKGWRVAMSLLGIVAIVLGGSRTSFAMVLAITIGLPLAKKRFFQFAALTAAAVLLLVTVHFITVNSKFNQVGFLRIFSLTSSRLAQSSDAEGNMEWRKVRWSRAWEEIKQHPLIGKGYGGLKNVVFLGRNIQQQSEEESIE